MPKENEPIDPNITDPKALRRTIAARTVSYIVEKFPGALGPFEHFLSIAGTAISPDKANTLREQQTRGGIQSLTQEADIQKALVEAHPNDTRHNEGRQKLVNHLETNTRRLQLRNFIQRR